MWAYVTTEKTPGVCEEVHEERKHDVVGLWTQTLLARDELDGWSGLRPYEIAKASE